MTLLPRCSPIARRLLLGALMMGASAFADEPDIAEALAPIGQDRLFRTAKVGLHVVDALTGEELYDKGGDEQFYPASTMKVVTAAAALDALGPAYRFTTDVRRNGKIDGRGVLWGDLHVRGGGDPTLVVERLWKLVYDLRVQGITKVTGDVVFDESFLGPTYELPAWGKPEDLERGPPYFSYQGSLSLNFNTVALVIAPGAEVDDEARVYLETPAGDYVKVESTVTTVATSSSTRIEVERSLEDGQVAFALSGRIKSGATPRKIYRTIVDPTAHFMAAFKEMMKRHEINVTGRFRRGEVPPSTRPVAQLRSPPLASILMDMNKFSNNHMAESVLRAMGAVVKGSPGTSDKGLEVVSEYLDRIGVPRGEYKVVNGSGLSRQGWLRPSHLTRILVDMASNPQVGHEFRASLAIAGLDGTLWRRLRDEPNRLRGKTGTIDGVHCLVGYVEGGDGRLYAFAFFANGLRAGSRPVRSLHDRMARRLFEVGAPSEPEKGGQQGGQ